MNKKLVLSLSIAVLAVTALFAGNQTIKSINEETTQAMSSTVNEANNITTVASDPSTVLPSESNEAAKPVAEVKEKSPAPSNNEAHENRISAAEAEAIALKKAGFSASEVYDKEVELDNEKGVWVYEVSFDKDRTDYDYVIDAVSGEILHSKVEPDNKNNTKPTDKAENSSAVSNPKNEAEKISAAEAEAIALKKAGFSASEVYDKEVELDNERGVWVYEVSFNKGRTDYDYVIDAVSGEILRADSDID